MAGSYADAPSNRMPFDADGTVVITHRTDVLVPTELNGTQKAIINNESSDYYQFGNDAPNHTILIFPELRELDGIFHSYTTAGAAGAVHSSPDTTNGLDGTWNQQIADLANYTSTVPQYRTSITSMAVATEKALRIYTANASVTRMQSLHVYGNISPGETPDRLLFLDTENSDAVFTKPLDYGDAPRGQTTVRTIKVKNNSGSLTINTIQITAEDLTLNAGDWFTFSSDGVSYQATLPSFNLGPGATKLVYVKHAVPDSETLGLQAGRILASHASLS